MKITSRFTIAVHTLLCIQKFQGQYKTTSEFIAASVNVNPVIIRKVLGQLKSATLVKVFAGSGGAELTRDMATITLLDIYRAVDCVEGGLFNFHPNPNLRCPIGKNIHGLLDGYLAGAEQVLEDYFSQITLAEVATKLQNLM